MLLAEQEFDHAFFFPSAVPKCGEFNFTLTALNPDEYILKAELHLWLNVHSPPQQNTYVVGIQPIYPSGVESRPIMRLLDVGDTDQGGYRTFEVNELLRDLVREGEHLFFAVFS